MRNWLSRGAAVAFAISAALPAAGAVVISEIYRNPDGADDGREFIEILGDPNQSLNGISLLIIEGDNGSANVRQIQQIFSLDGKSTGSNGLLLWRDSTTVLTPAPDSNTNVHVENWTDMQNGDMTVVLVTGLTGTVGTSVDSNGDGTVDNTPWATTLDAFDFHETGARSVYASQFGGWAPADQTPPAEKNAYVRSGNVRFIIDTNQPTNVPNGPYTISTPASFQTDTTGAVWDPAWTLTPGSINPVPEPGAAILVGLAGIALLRRRQ